MNIQVDSSGVLDSAGVYALIWWAQASARSSVVELVASCPTVGSTHVATAIRIDHRGWCTGCIRHTEQTVENGIGPAVQVCFPHYSTVVGQRNTIWVLACLCIYSSTCMEVRISIKLVIYTVVRQWLASNVHLYGWCSSISNCISDSTRVLSSIVWPQFVTADSL